MTHVPAGHRLVRPAAPPGRRASRISAARRQCRHRRRARGPVPAISLTRPAWALPAARSAALFRPHLERARGGDAMYPIFNAGAGRANVRLTEAQRAADRRDYQRAIQTAFREVAGRARPAGHDQSACCRAADAEGIGGRRATSSAKRAIEKASIRSSTHSTRSETSTLRNARCPRSPDRCARTRWIYRTLGGDSCIPRLQRLPQPLLKPEPRHKRKRRRLPTPPLFGNLPKIRCRARC